MPLYRIQCPACAMKAARLARTPGEATARPCGACGGLVQRVPTGLSTVVRESLDSGAMPRALERLADAERLYHDRAAASDPLAGRGHTPAD